MTWKIDEILQHALQEVVINIECRPLFAQCLLVHLPVTNHDDELAGTRGNGAEMIERPGRC